MPWIAGVNPVYGLYAGIIAAIIGSAFGSSNQLITGPTNAICLLTASAMARYMGLSNAYQMLFLMTFMVGILQIIYGVIKLGKVIDFVSHTVLIGFTAGAGVLIALGQVKYIAEHIHQEFSRYVNNAKNVLCWNPYKSNQLLCSGTGTHDDGHYNNFQKD